MRNRAIFFALGLAGWVSALLPATAPPVVTPAPVAGDGLVARQDDKCALSLASMVVHTPSMPSELADWAATAAPSILVGVGVPKIDDDDDIEEFCSAAMSPTPPASLESAYSSWSSEAANWQSSVASEVSTLTKQCEPTLAFAMELLLVTDVPHCTSVISKFVDNSSPRMTSPRIVAAAAAASVAVVLGLF